ncbi:MAG: ATP-dependent DNA helicase RecQ [Actinomycetia bacterium]|nr:ATP-dependent DNA helicase RecQ [Actinomycetes bacterium]
MTEPPRPTPAEVEVELTAHIQALAGPDAVPRPEQLAAVTAVVAHRQRTLLVARTGFGKSGVYFSATRMLRDRGWGPTIVVSPLLALMRDQVEAARRLGLAAETINSSNLDDWGAIEERIHADEVDLLLIAPERLANAGFRRRVFDMLLVQSQKARPFSLVCDEAHCISDWGHDFRPDYRRLRALLDELPAWTPVLATTATANQRVTDDVAAQLGAETLVLRTSLDRASLHLSVVDLPDDAHRLAWLAETIDDLAGSGIIYCLTVNQAETTAVWLRQQGHRVAAYTGAVEPEQRVQLESGLRANELKALVATSALGMGFDKGDLAFCVHLGLPPSPVAYYQQIGRAGRNLDRAEVIAVPRPTEDAAVWRWFESVSLPSEEICRSVLARLDTRQATSIAALETSVNLGRTRLGTLLNILEVDGAVERVQGGFVLADRPGPGWEYDHQLAASLRQLRRAEADQMREWVALDSCRLRYLRESLDDMGSEGTGAADCGRCDVCTGTRRGDQPNFELVTAAQHVLRGTDVAVEPRKQWPTGLDEPKGRIKPERQAAMGRALAQWGDGGWGPIVESLILAADRGEEPDLSEAVVRGLAGVLKRWTWGDRPTWICPVPSRRRSGLIDEVAARLGNLGNLPVHRALVADPDHPGGWQADQGNSAHQVAGVWGRLSVDASQLPPDRAVFRGPVLLVDDEADSRWTLTVASWVLTGVDAGPVLPIVLRAR